MSMISKISSLTWGRKVIVEWMWGLMEKDQVFDGLDLNLDEGRTVLCASWSEGAPKDETTGAYIGTIKIEWWWWWEGKGRHVSDLFGENKEFLLVGN